MRFFQHQALQAQVIVVRQHAALTFLLNKAAAVGNLVGSDHDIGTGIVVITRFRVLPWVTMLACTITYSCIRLILAVRSDVKCCENSSTFEHFSDFADDVPPDLLLSSILKVTRRLPTGILLKYQIVSFCGSLSRRKSSGVANISIFFPLLCR